MLNCVITGVRVKGKTELLVPTDKFARLDNYRRASYFLPILLLSTLTPSRSSAILPNPVNQRMTAMHPKPSAVPLVFVAVNPVGMRDRAESLRESLSLSSLRKLSASHGFPSATNMHRAGSVRPSGISLKCPTQNPGFWVISVAWIWADFEGFPAH